MTAVDDARKSREALFGMTERLVADYVCVPSGRVLSIVALCRSELSRAGVPAERLLEATEAMVRSHLEVRIPRPRHTPASPKE